MGLMVETYRSIIVPEKPVSLENYLPTMQVREAISPELKSDIFSGSINAMRHLAGEHDIPVPTDILSRLYCSRRKNV
jgi:hypothetical protein